MDTHAAPPGATGAPERTAQHATDGIALDDAWRLMAGARWFGGKGRSGRVTDVVALDWIVAPGGDAPAVRPEIATVRYADGGREQYQLLMAYSPMAGRPGHVGDAGSLGQAYDAPRNPEAMAAVVRALHQGASSPSWQVVITHPLPGDTASLAPRLFTGEQSNTTVVLGDVALLKLFRKLEPGRNLDIQVHDALNRVGVRSVARLYGWMSASPAGSAHADPVADGVDLFMLVEKIAGVEDGWEFALQHAAEGRDFRDDAARLGSSLRAIHDALRDTFPTQTLDGSELASGMVRRLDAAVIEAPQLAEHRDGLAAVFANLDGRHLRAQRIHGDFHLGQTLHVSGASGDGSWRIIDFEGEPMKQMWERLLPDSPWRDVAGMLRSLSYATSGSNDPGSPAMQEWLAGSRQAFLRAYAGHLTADDAAVLAAYEADKAVYEVIYEARNRPDWIQIPLRAVAQLTAAAPTGSTPPRTSPPSTAPS